MTLKTILNTTLIALLALLLVACGGEPPEPEPIEEDQVPSMVVEPEATEIEPTEVPQLTILADGQIQNGRPALPLGFETGGKLLAINVAVGDTGNQ